MKHLYYWLVGILILFLLYSCGGGGGGSTPEDTTPPHFTSLSSVTVAENTTAVLLVTTDDANAILNLGGTDAALFELQASGALFFKTAPDYENPADMGGDNLYELVISATDGAGNTATQELQITVTDVDESVPDTTPPTFTSPPSAAVTENTTAVLLVTTDDANATLGLGGTDAALFELQASGALFFKTAPDYENPADMGGDNLYELVISATDGAGNTATQELQITVTDVDELPVIPLVVLKTGQTKSYDENGSEVLDDSIRDDGYYRSGVDRNYTRDDINGIVTDHVMGLMWQDDGVVVIKQWVSDTAALDGNYSDTSGDTATTYCETLDLGGYTDWRLPTVQELKSLVDYSQHEPPTDPIFENAVWSYYWSSTTLSGLVKYAWCVKFVGGDSGRHDKVSTQYVRCVRDGQ